MIHQCLYNRFHDPERGFHTVVAGLIFVLFTAFTAFPALSHSLSPEISTPKQVKPLVYGKQSMVVTNNPWASKVAAKILAHGGNAVDAAVSAAFVLGLTEPQSSGLGGGGYGLVFNKSNQSLTAYSGREMAPHSATSDLFLDHNGRPLPFSTALLTPQSVGVPGEVALLFLMHKQHGKLAWASLIQPALELARQGFPMSPRLHTLLKKDQGLLLDPEIQKVYFTQAQSSLPFFQKYRQVRAVGSLVKNLAYARTLEIIAEDPMDFYRGHLAKQLVNKINLNARQPLFTLHDLKQYRPLVAKPLCATYHEHELCTTPFESGGISVLELLKIYVSAKSSTSYPWIYLFLEASKLAFADRNQYIADPHFVPQPVQGLLDPIYIRKRAQLIQKRALITPVSAGKPRGSQLFTRDRSHPLPGTTSLTIVDRQGQAVSLTLTIEHQFGSHLFVNGYFLNNQLTDFSTIPTMGRRYSKPIANSISAFKRPRSAISPFMVFDSHGLIFLTGSPGGSQIICYVAKNLIQVLDFQQSPRESIASGNLCSTNSRPVVEKDSDLIQFLPQLYARGERVKVDEMVSGLVNIQRGPNGGWFGAADPRREGEAIGK